MEHTIPFDTNKVLAGYLLVDAGIVLALAVAYALGGGGAQGDDPDGRTFEAAGPIRGPVLQPAPTGYTQRLRWPVRRQPGSSPAPRPNRVRRHRKPRQTGARFEEEP
jgi:hypothetical protein